MKDLIWIEISKKNLRHNIQTMRRLIGGNVLLAPCLKTNAYGHGLIEIAKLLVRYKADWFALDSIHEARILRKVGISLPLLVMNYVQKKDLHQVLKLKLRILLDDYQIAKELSRLARKKGKVINVHIKIDTGLARRGIIMSRALDFINKVSRLKNIKIEGLATHFATADEIAKKDYFYQQWQQFHKLLSLLKSKGGFIPVVHCANSAAAILYPQSYFNLVRIGLAIYGYYDSPVIERICQKKGISFLPTLSFKTKVALIKGIPAHSYVSYGCTFRTKRKTKIAILPVGYYDGLDRKLGNKGWVLIKGKKAKILGRVCMNMTIVDITHLDDVRPEEEVVIIGQQGKENISLENIANLTDTVNYEVCSRLRESIPRYYI